jgi:hypothetical protein
MIDAAGLRPFSLKSDTKAATGLSRLSTRQKHPNRKPHTMKIHPNRKPHTMKISNPSSAQVQLAARTSVSGGLRAIKVRAAALTLLALGLVSGIGLAQAADPLVIEDGKVTINAPLNVTKNASLTDTTINTLNVTKNASLTDTTINTLNVTKNASLTDTTINTLEVTKNASLSDTTINTLEVINATTIKGNLTAEYDVFVGGDVMIGKSDSFAPTSYERLRIVRGWVDNDGRAFRGSGIGFTSEKLSLGVYRITFAPAFNDIPAVTVTGGVKASTAVILDYGPSYVKIEHHVPTDSNKDTRFSFIAIGAR